MQPKKSYLGWIIAGVVLVVAAIGYGIYAYFKGKGDAALNTTDDPTKHHPRHPHHRLFSKSCSLIL
jgi:flagellar basal body-associated protein FliL